jgi:hypothetical protein
VANDRVHFSGGPTSFSEEGAASALYTMNTKALYKSPLEKLGLVKNGAKKGMTFLRTYRGADNFLPRPTFRCVFFYGENISFDASLVIYINSTNIPLIMIINRIYKYQNLLSL